MARLKGHSVIELTDVKSGKKETFENDNLITNAPEEILGLVFKRSGNAANRACLPLINRTMGGIYLFDTALTENANNKFLPDASVARLTGYAGNATSDGNDNMRGDFNANESGEIENGYKMVWDFGTDDANGEIAALALTHHIAGYHGYHYNARLASYSNENNGGNLPTNYKGINFSGVDIKNIFGDIGNKIISIDTDEKGYIANAVSYTSNTKIVITKFRLRTDNLLLTDENVAIWTQESTEEITISDSYIGTSSNPSYSYFQFIDGKNGYYYGLAFYEYRIYLSKLNKTTKEYTQCTVSTRNTSKYYYDTQPTSYTSFRACIRNNYLYIARRGTTSTSGNNIYYFIDKISINNLDESVTLNDTEIRRTTYGCFTLLNNNIIDTGDYLITLEDELIENGATYYNGSSSNTYSIREYTKDYINILHYYERGYNTYEYLEYYFNFQYLATINNLDSPVVKTAAKTMKITYTLTYA